MEKIKLPYKTWKQFASDCINHSRCDQNLFSISVEFMSKDCGSVKKNTHLLYQKLEETYHLEHIALSDIESFLSRVCLLAKAKDYLPTIPERSDEVPGWIKKDAYNRMMSEVYHTPTDAREDLYGSAYLDTFAPHVTY